MNSEVKHVSYEIQPMIEVWRTKRHTFNVMYPTHDTAVIMALRGEFKREDYLGLNNIFCKKGIRKIIFERDVNGKLVQKERLITTSYPSVIANTFERKE